MLVVMLCGQRWTAIGDGRAFSTAHRRRLEQRVRRGAEQKRTRREAVRARGTLELGQTLHPTAALIALADQYVRVGVGLTVGAA